MLIIVVTMFLDDQKYTQNGKIYRRVLLRNSYRVEGKVHHTTIANLSQCSDEEIKAIKLALKHKGNLKKVIDVQERVKIRQGLSVGAVWVLNQLAKQLGISKALGHSREAKLALWLVLASVIEQGSRLSATRMAKRHAVCDILQLDSFCEDDLYQAMDWLNDNQQGIEKSLFTHRYADRGKPQFYLYDVTSSYLEGDQNELGEWGYNRDGKKGKKQIVIGLMTDKEGWPICIEVFEGNTNDTATVKNQIKKMANRFGVEQVTLVGDRGMIKSTQISDLSDEHFHYITAITKVQVEKLIKDGVFQMSFFDEKLFEISYKDVRYILRRNPIRAQEIADVRESKLNRLNKFIAKQNQYLAEHSRAQVEVARKQCLGKSQALKIDQWATVKAEGRVVCVEVNSDKRDDESRLDGCYVIKTDLSANIASTQAIHSRYKDLAEVEFAFRTMKTTLLEMRGIFVRKANHTRAHVFIIMLGYLLAYQLRRLWYDVEVTVEEGIKELASICSVEVVSTDGQLSYQTIPEPRELGKTILAKTGISLPDAIPCRKVNVDTRKKLISERKNKKIQNLNPKK
ncbi:MAG TPA: IS1634 family transposase [Desulfatiglandales bacterium]|nr:IS1634 family transposase [Desulfatiglandales bacterium]